MKFSQAQFEAACKAGRREVDKTGFGSWVSDAKIATVVEAILSATEDADDEPSEPVKPRIGW